MPDDVEKCEINDLDYITNNKIALCSSNTPARYKRVEYFAKSNLPKEESNMFNEITPPEIKLISCNQAKIEIELDAKKFLKYTLFRKDKNEITKICSVTNKQGKVILVDNDILYDKFYTYFVATDYSYADTENIKTAGNFDLANLAKSNEIKIFLAQKSPLIIHKKWAS